MRQQSSSPTQARQLQACRDERSPEKLSHGTSSEGNRAITRRSRGNPQQDCMLRMKADELEKLFSAHMASSKRGRSPDLKVDGGSSSSAERSPAEITNAGFMGDINPMCVCDAMRILASLGEQEDCRGRFYERYALQRDAKLKQERETKRGQKEANIKSMLNSLEKTLSMWQAKFAAVTAGMKDLAPQARTDTVECNDHQIINHTEEGNADKQLSENLKSHRDALDNCTSINSSKLLSDRNSSSSATRTICRASVPSSQREQVRPSSQVAFRGNRSYTSDASSKCFDPMKLLSNTTVSSPTSLTPPVPVARGSGSNSKSNSLPGPIRRRSQHLKTCPQSDPNYISFRKENTKPLNGISKVNAATRPRSHARSKSTTAVVRVISPLNPNNANMTSNESRQLLRKSNGTGPRAGGAKRKSSIANSSEALKSSGDESKAVVIGKAGDCDRTIDYLACSDSEVAILSSRGSIELVDPLSGVRDVQECWSEDIPSSWNPVLSSNASVDSPAVSPALHMNPQPGLNQTHQADTPRSRKRWGSAQNPFSVSNASRQSPKDATTGFKRLLNFGWKRRGADSAVTDFLSMGSTAPDVDVDVDTTDKCNMLDSRMLKPDYAPYSFDGNVYHEKAHRLRFSLPSIRKASVT